MRIPPLVVGVPTSSPMNTSPVSPRTLFSVLALLVASGSAHAQVGYDWSPLDTVTKLHQFEDRDHDPDPNNREFNERYLPVPAPDPYRRFFTSPYNTSGVVIADYELRTSRQTETFRLIGDHTVAANRNEIRIQDNYGPGQIRQFEGYVTFYGDVNNQCLFQIWGHEFSANAAQLMIDGYKDSGGRLVFTGTSQTYNRTNLRGVELKLNVIHAQETNSTNPGAIRVYIDGELVINMTDSMVTKNITPNGNNYMKYGIYGGVKDGYDVNTPYAVWKNARYFRDGSLPGSTTQSISGLPTTLTKYSGDAPFSPGATASSGLPVQYRSDNLSVARITSDNRVEIVAAGTATIWASQAGDSRFAPAPVKKQLLTVTDVPVPQTQTISFPSSFPASGLTKNVSDANFLAGASASSGLPVTYTSNNTTVATVVATTGEIDIRAVGSTIITASQAGNAAFLPATPVSRTLTVTNPVTYYKINLRANPALVLTSTSASPVNGTNVNVTTDNNSATQHWTLVDVGAGFVRIVPRLNAGMALDCSTTPANGVNVQLWSYNGNDRQRWLRTAIAGTGSEKVTVRANAAFGLDCASNPAVNGANVQMWTYNANNTNQRQQWIFESVTVSQ